MRRQGKSRTKVYRQAFALVDRRLGSVSLDFLEKAEHLLFFLLNPTVVFLYRVLHNSDLGAKIVGLLALL